MNLNDLKNFFGLHEKSFVPNVGIGTATPTQPLHVAGIARADTAFYVGTGAGTSMGNDNLIRPTASSAFLNVKGGSGKGKIGIGNEFVTITSGDSSGYIRFTNDATSSTTVGTEVMRLTGGAVGIGTTSPQAVLDVASTTSGQSTIIVPRDTTVNRPATGINGMIRFNSTTNKFEAYQGTWMNMIGAAGSAASGANGALQYSDGSGGFLSNNNVVVDGTNGRLGIGTSAPGAKLDVLGYNINVGADWATGSARTNANSKGGYLTFPHYTNAQSPITMIGSLNDGTTNSVNIGGGTSNYNASTDIKFYTASNNTTLTGTERMRIDSSGNIGIGTTSPNVALDVVGNANISGTITASQTFATLTDGATITWTVAGLVNNATVTLGGNRTLAFSGLTNGMSGTLIVKQDGGGSKTLALPSQCTNKVINGGGATITLSTAGNAIDILTFVYDGTNCYWTYGTNYN